MKARRHKKILFWSNKRSGKENEMKWNSPFEREYWRQTVNVKNRHVALAERFKGRKIFALPTFATRHYIEFQFSLSFYVSWHRIFTHWQHTTRMYFIMSLMNFDIMCGCWKIFYTVYCLSLGFNGIRFLAHFWKLVFEKGAQ